MREARTRDEALAAQSLRRRVFAGEQGVELAERDRFEGRVIQVVAFSPDERLVGTCRLLVTSGVARLSWLAVEEELRGEGAGATILAEAERLAREAGAARVRLHARLAALTLYERAGYLPRGEVFVMEGIDHLTMEKELA